MGEGVWQGGVVIVLRANGELGTITSAQEGELEAVCYPIVLSSRLNAAQCDELLAKNDAQLLAWVHRHDR